jgi:hypothetical protein
MGDSWYWSQYLEGYDMDVNRIDATSIPALPPLTDEEDHNLAKALRGVDYGKVKRALDSPVMYVEDMRDGRITYEFVCIPHDEALRIIQYVLPNVLNLWLQKTSDYGDDHALDLGPKAEFVRIWNKIHKLKRGLWDGKPLAGESVGDILCDLIGHSLRILDRIWGSPNRPGEVK